MRREKAVKEALNRTLAQLVEASSVSFLAGDAQFLDPHTIAIRQSNGCDVLRAERILIATGSSPIGPPEFPFASPGVCNSETILDLNTIPGRARMRETRR